MRAVDPRTGVGAGLLIVLCFSAATIGFTVYGPLLIIRLHDVRALTAGYLVASSSIGWSVMSISSQASAEKRDGTHDHRRDDRADRQHSGTSCLPYPMARYGPCCCWPLLEGIGFGMSWTFTLRRMTLLAPESDAERAASAMPTLQQLGYAIGAAYVGIVPNAAGIADRSAATARNVGFWIFAACLPLAAVGLYAAWCFVRFGEARKG